MTNYFVSRKYFYAIYSILLILLILILITYTKEEIFFAINGNNNSFFDYFFYLFTELGNTWTYIIVILMSLLLPRRYTFMLISSLILSSILSQGLKHFVFEHEMRPLKYFTDPGRVHHLKISDLLYNHSFPSGHSISIFSLVTILVAISKKRWYDLVLLLIACLAAYSRVYLGQHFFADVLYGSLIGVFSGTLSISIFRNEEKYKDPFIRKKSMTPLLT